MSRPLTVLTRSGRCVVTSPLRYSAHWIAARLGLPRPTEQQRAVIEADPSGTARVIAGAGSGKTETMALRVVYLVANGVVEPHRILGLTFTNKAAGELHGRLQRRLRQLTESATLDLNIDPFHAPQVSTYNAFATRLFSDYSVYLGIDGDTQVASPATAWGLARSVVAASTDPTLETLDFSLDRVTGLVVSLAHEIAEHDVNSSDIDALVQRMRTLRDLPPGGRGLYAGVDELVDHTDLLSTLLPLVESFRQAKRDRGLLEFADQVALGLDLARSVPAIPATLREDYQVVLLDEYQDTSVLQTTLLATLFSGHPVMAVGDPYQAIYGWRGASASNLADFERDFGAGTPVQTFSLDTSWRNPPRVLAAANVLARSLGDHTPVHVGTLQPRPEAEDGVLDVVVRETVAEEAEAVAEWFQDHLATSDEPPSAAVLLRHRAHQDVLVRALRRRGVPVHVLGVGGLLADPVVADLVCLLTVVHLPPANSEWVRLLAGGKFRIGVSDLHALSRHATQLVRESTDSEAEDAGLLRPTASLQDALADLCWHSDQHPSWRRVSPEGRVRLRAAQRLLDQAARARHDDLLDQLSHCERLLGLESEALAHPEGPASPQTKQAFFEAAARYRKAADTPDAPGFLRWLREAEHLDQLAPRPEPAEPGCVQIVTIHGAKGLEWDLVALPRWVDDELPHTPREGFKGWLRPGRLPYSLRGDRDALPVFSWEHAETRKDLLGRIDEFASAQRDHHEREERRLAYVGITRAAQKVLLSASWWAHHTTPRRPSVFLRELEEAGLCEPLPSHSAHETSPIEQDGEGVWWPGDPLGSRRESVRLAADQVRRALPGTAEDIAEPLREVLVRAVERETAPHPEASLPHRLSASMVQRLLTDPEGLARALVRPVPKRVTDATSRGTVFHDWVEKRYLEATESVVLADIDPWDIDDREGAGDPDVWREAFLQSPYASLRPLAIEREIHLPLAGHTVVCKIDAVFPRDEGGHLVVDWKTGSPPTGDQDEADKAIQLALYRLAWAHWQGINPTRVDAVWWFSQTGETRAPSILLEFDDLEDRLRDAARRYRESSTNR